MSNYKVTAIGEILYDVYPDQKRLGGAPFNFIYHVWKMLGKANFVSSVGNDINGNEILSYLGSNGFDTKYMSIDNEHPTGTVSVTIREDKVPQFKISAECSYDYITLNETTESLIKNETDLLYFGTLAARDEITRATILSLFGKPHLKYFCDLNLRHDFFSKDLIEQILNTCSIIKINDSELQKLRSLFGLPSSDNDAVQILIREFNLDLVALTLGADGSELFGKSEFNYYINPKREVVDTLGAGDAYSSILCLGYLCNMPIPELNKLASEFAREICMVSGALPADDSIYIKYQNIFRDL
jgi:fructokinase